MELKIRKNGDIYIIDVNGEMDLYNSYKLKELVMKMLEKNVKFFIINLEQVDYIDSSGIGALIYICSTIKKMNLRLSIANIHGSVKKSHRTDKADRIFSDRKQHRRRVADGEGITFILRKYDTRAEG